MPRASSAPVDDLLDELWKRAGTDLILTAGAPPLLRIDGVIHPVQGKKPLKPEDTERIVFSMLTPGQGQALKTDKEIDFSFNWKETARFRANVFHQRGSVGLALRLIPYHIPSFEELLLPAVVQRFVTLPQGLILVTGPTGAGKSTTLASMINHINRHRACHILTIEDPIEYVHKHNKSVVNQREVGEDTDSFSRALRSALREDPDVLLVGEMRDLETIRTTLTIAETGHLVFATLHTNDTAQALDRIVDVFPGEHQQQIRIQLANSLQGILYQQLVPKVEGGRVAAFEVLVASHAVRNLIKEGKTGQIRNVVATSQREGMQTFEDGLSELVASGAITYEDAVSRSLYPNQVKRRKPTIAEGPEDVPRRRLMRR